MAKKILIMDDEELIIKTLSKLLEREKFQIMIAKNGPDAIAMADEEEFDLIVADIRMPGMNGVRAVENIYEGLKKNNLKKIPVIFVTGYADESVEGQARKLLPIGYIYKPFNMPDLLDVVKEALK
jgi:CheY-like chemotaxis protein